MSGEVTCSNCHRRFRLPGNFAAKRVRCICGSVMETPGVDPASDSMSTELSGRPDIHRSHDASSRRQSLLDEELPHQLRTAPGVPAPSGDGTSETSRGAAKHNTRAYASRRHGQPSDESEDRLRYPVQEYLEAAEAKFREREAEKLRPTRFPLAVGVFDFPWRLTTLGSWIPMSVMLTIAGGMLAFLFTYGVQAGLAGVRTVGVAAGVATVMALCYATACCVTVIQETANGTVSIEEWPAVLNWKEWAWGSVFAWTMLLESAALALLLTFWLGRWTWVPTIVLSVAIFPIVYLASSEAGMWVPCTARVLGGLTRRPLLWGLFLSEYIGVLVGSSVLCGAAIYVMHWWALLVCCPLIAAAMLIEARLIGRIAWCLSSAGGYSE